MVHSFIVSVCWIQSLTGLEDWKHLIGGEVMSLDQLSTQNPQKLVISGKNLLSDQLDRVRLGLRQALLGVVLVGFKGRAFQT